MFVVARSAAASPEDVLGVGPRSSGMGGTGVSVATGYEAARANPALLGLERGSDVSVGFAGAFFGLHGRSDIPERAVHGLSAGGSYTVGGHGIWKDRIGVGASFFLPAAESARDGVLLPQDLQFPFAEDARAYVLHAGLGIDVGGGVRFGVGLASIASHRGPLFVSSGGTRKRIDAGDGLFFGVAPVVGASYDLGDHFRVGAVFRGERSAKFEAAIEGAPGERVQGFTQHEPWRIDVETSRARGHWRGALGLSYAHGSALAGDADTLAVRLGIERLIELTPDVNAHLRVGYWYLPSASPDQTRAANRYDDARSAVTLGYGVALFGAHLPIDLDVYSQFELLHLRMNRKDDDIPHDNPGWPSQQAGGAAFAGGAAARYRF